MRGRKPANYFSGSLDRGLRVIRAFSRERPMMRITDIAQAAGIDRAVARRFLLTLVDLGYVGRSDDFYYLRPQTLDIGFSYLASLDVTHIVQPSLNELSAATRETSSFGILDGSDIRLLARSASHAMLNVSVPLGTRYPAHSASIGLVLLAGLPPEEFDAWLRTLPPELQTPFGTIVRRDLEAVVEEARSSGWAAIEKGPGRAFCSIAVPIRDQAGVVVAGLNVLEYPPRSSVAGMARKYLPLLSETSKQIEAALRSSPQSILAILADRDAFRP